MSKTTTTQSSEIRAEDFMKSMLEKAKPLSEKQILKGISEYLLSLDKQPRHLILVSNEVGYYQVFDNEDKLDVPAVANHILGFLNESFFSKGDSLGQMRNVLEIENSNEVEGLDIWIDKVYFQLAPFDWGVEKVYE